MLVVSFQYIIIIYYLQNSIWQEYTEQIESNLHYLKNWVLIISEINCLKSYFLSFSGKFGNISLNESKFKLGSQSKDLRLKSWGTAISCTF